MIRTRVPALLAAAALLALALPGPGAAQTGPARTYLPPDYVMAKVGPRTIRAQDFSSAYFNSDPETRPRPDSLGRAQFLGTLVKRDVMGLVALQINPPLDFAARGELRSYTSSLMRNLLYQRMVLDSITVTEEEIRKTYEQYKQDVRVEHIQVEERLPAERIRQELVSKKITWEQAVKRYSTAEDRAKNGDLGWRNRLSADPGLGQAIFSLEIGEISPVFADPNGYHIARVAEKRPGKPPAFEPIRAGIEDQIRNQKAAVRTRRIQEQQLTSYDVTYEQSNLAWAAKQFFRPMTFERVNGQPSVTIDPNVPEAAPEDTGRVLARFRGGQISFGRLLAAYSAIEPLLRPSIDTPEMVQGQVDVLILEPRMLEMAHERGLDRDTLAVKLIEFRREGMLVERLYADSIESQVRVTDAARRKYYKEHLAEFITFPRVRFAAFVRPSRESADSLKKALLGGLKPQDLIIADSLRGVTRGSIQERTQNDPGSYHKLLFEELRPGQVTVEGPDKSGDFVVIQLLSFDPGRQLTYEESTPLVDELVRHQEEERIFEAFIARHSRKLAVEAHPELVMRVEFKAI